MYSNLSLCKFTFHFTAIPLVWSIIYLVTSSYTYYIYLNDQALSSIPKIKMIISIIFYLCSSMTLICHTFCIYNDPGTLDYSRVEKLNDDQKEFCIKCNKPRPLRAHHCSTCDRCIMKMDHHCPWVFNCVGYGNQKIFFLFLFYATLGCFIAFACLVTIFFTDHFSYLLRHPKYKIDFNANFFLLFIQIVISLSDAFSIIMGTVLALAMTISIGGLLYTQYSFISRNVTGVEDTIFDNEPEMNPWYAKTHRWFMFKTVLGLGPKWKWFLPIVEENKYNSGYLYDTPYERIVKKKEVKKNKDDKEDKENNKKGKNSKNKKNKNKNKIEINENSYKCGC